MTSLMLTTPQFTILKEENSLGDGTIRAIGDVPVDFTIANVTGIFNQAVTTAKKKGFNVSIVRDLIGFQKKEKFTSLLRKWEKSGINIIEKKEIVA